MMTLDEAIEILTNFNNGKYPGSAENFQKAVKLGREALKAWRLYRKQKTPTNYYLLPGETKE